MPSMKMIKRRISSVTTTRQVMKAMDMVAATKLKKTRVRLDAARPLFIESQRIIESVKDCDGAADNIFVRRRGNAERKKVAYLVITGDRGLCGSYNVNVSEKALGHMREDQDEKVVAIGLKGWEFFKRRRKNVIRRYLGVSETALYEDASRIGDLIIAMYTAGEIDEAYIAYTRFESSLTYVPMIARILPIASDADEPRRSGLMRYEPDVNVFLEYAIPSYIKTLIYGALVESSTCEQAARMVSMSAASNNAEEIISDLTHTHNRMRQASITQEINEIISGANMLN